MPIRTRLARLVLGLAIVADLSGSATLGAAAGRTTAPDRVRPAAIADSFAPLAVTGGGIVHVPSTAIPSAAPTSFAVRPAPRLGRPAQPKSVSRTQTRPAKARPSPPTTAFRGRNHVWIPAIGVDRSISFFACTSSAYPGDRVYRWGCAGPNNVYLFGHASSVFKPLHDAYVRGRLAKGMKVYRADAAGQVSTYAVAWWRVTTPDKGAFAYAAQRRPSMTLQTCVGARSQYRLIVRLVKVG